MTRTGSRTTTRPWLSRRSRIVWLSFFVAMTVVTGILMLGEPGVGGGGYLVAANVGALGDAPRHDPVFDIDVPLDEQRWTGIVVHHLGEPAGDAEYVHRLHQSYGYQGLGYHFLIGNGRGLGDGIIQVGYRWNEQLPGAHVVGEQGPYHNEHAIAVCLIGNGDRRAFTDRQMRSLISLVRRLQRRLGIPPEGVVRHCDLAPEVTSPGRFFATARLDEGLIE